MKDIDFDELDKAVNSLMTNVPKTDEPREAREKTLDLTPPAGTGPATTPLATPSVPTPPQSGVSTAMPRPSTASGPVEPSASPTPASRRGGRFMDVVHPSSDMKGQTPSVPSRPVSRQGVSVEPRPGAVQPEERPPQPPEPSPVLGAPVQGVSMAPTPAVTEKTPPANEWPDPLEMTSFKNNREEPKKEAPTPIETPSIPDEQVARPEEGEEESKEEQSPLTSPFLPGAKVEKRPLGGPAEEPDRTPLPGTETTKTADNPNDQLPALPEDVEPLLPEELQGDMMAVEADTHMGVPKTDETHPLKDEEVEPKKETVRSEPEPTPVEPKKEKPTPPPAASSAKPSSPEVETPSGPTSIPQQYREEPSTGDKKNGAIYDTDTYHKPLAHPAKKSSGWLWLLWIVIILLAGAGGGAALYLLGII